MSQGIQMIRNINILKNLLFEKQNNSLYLKVQKIKLIGKIDDHKPKL